MKFSILFTIIIYISCNSKSKYANNDDKIDSLKNSLLGKWGGAGEDSPVIEIRKDSIYYYQRHSAFHYKIINSDVLIDLPDTKGELKNVYVNGDTLFFTGGEGALIRAIRFR